MSEIMEHAKFLVEFLGQVMGPNCEVVLQDVEARKIIAISNGNVSGRKLNSPLTDLALKVIASDTWKEVDYQLNYDGMTSDGKILRSSTFFIKEKGSLLGMLCINIDTSKYEELSEEILKLGGISTMLEDSNSDNNTSEINSILPEIKNQALHGHKNKHTRRNSYSKKNASPIEVFSNTMSDIVQTTINQCLADKGNIPVSRLTQDEKLEIIVALNEKGVFLLKGSISDVAEYLECSKASIYRYLSKLQKD